MRRRWTLGSIPMHIDKGNGNTQKRKLCFLSSLCILFWVFLLLFYHFIVIGGTSISLYYGTTTTLQSNPIKIEHFNSDSSSNPEEIKNTNATNRSKIVAKSQPSNSNHVGDPEEVEDTNVTNHSKIQDKSRPTESNPVVVKTKDEPKKTRNPKDEPQDFPFMRALRTSEDKRDPCGGKYIYVHNLPSRFNKDMLKACRTLSRWTNMCKYTTNAGLGPPLKNVRGVFSKTGWYATNQFAVDVIFNNRMKQYKCLTNDSSLAAAIFVPFYAGFDIARYLWGHNISTRDAASLDLVRWLTKRPEWRIMDGRDHFLVAGRITWDFRRLTDQESDWGSKLLFLPAAKNMSMLVVESSPWNANDFAIPYPTYFHPAKDSDVFFWQARMRKLKRQWLFSFAGAPRPGDPKSIRGQIINQCKKSSTCKLLECDSGESKCHSPSSIMKMFQSSLFCLQPQGDSYTRRSAFDAMLAGCIPVFFHPGSAYTQYTWHLPKNFSSYSVFISENDVRKGTVQIEKRLREIPPQEVKRMRETVIGLIPKLVYADPRSRLETLEDAFDMSVQAVIDKVTNLRRNLVQGRTSEYDGFVEQNSWKYALLEEGQREVGPHEWDPFFSKPKDGEEDPKSSWKNEQRSQLR